MLKNCTRKEDDLLSRLANNSNSAKCTIVNLPVVPTSRITMVTQEEVVAALTEIGLGPKLINQALFHMGFV